MGKYDSPDLTTLLDSLPTGAIPSPADERDFRFAPRALAPSALPRSAHISTYRRPARWQDFKGSCTTFGLTGILENEWRKAGVDFDGSEDFFFARMHEIYGTLCQNGGIPTRDAARAVCDEGILTEVERPYSTDLCTGTTPDERARAFPQRASGYYVCDSVDAIKAAIASDHGVLICMKVFASMLDRPDGFVPFWSGRELGDHAQYIEDYDDDRFGGTFGVVGSWGVGLGDNGRTYIPYSFADLPYEAGGIWLGDAWTFMGVAAAPQPVRRGRRVVTLSQVWFPDASAPGGWRVEDIARGERTLEEFGFLTSEFQIEGRETVYHSFEPVDAGDA